MKAALVTSFSYPIIFAPAFARALVPSPIVMAGTGAHRDGCRGALIAPGSIPKGAVQFGCAVAPAEVFVEEPTVQALINCAIATRAIWHESPRRLAFAAAGFWIDHTVEAIVIVKHALITGLATPSRSTVFATTAHWVHKSCFQ